MHHLARQARGFLLLPLLIACAVGATPAVAGEFMFMPTLAVVKERHQADNNPGIKKNQVIGDLFYSNDLEHLRFLGELQIDKDGQDMERLQAGWRLNPTHTVWFGRYHNPIGYWNVEHHHGHYMETSAERPRILEFEDEGGPLPIHLFGLLLQGTQAIGDAGLQYDLGVASGPKIKGDEFEPVDVIRHPTLNKLALVARLAYRPDATRDDQYGVFLARTRIPVEDLSFTQVDQNLAGIYISRDIGRLRLFGEAMRITHQLSQNAGAEWPSYWAGYIQAEYKLVPNVWTPFARQESISSRLTKDYTDLFPGLPKQRQLAGMRWDFYKDQALKFELIRDQTVGGVTFDTLEIQWSAMF